MSQTFKQKIRDYLAMIKFSHSIFALPFALSAMAMAWETRPVTAWTVIWIIVAMVSARSAAMGFNRIVDAAIDAKNERTAVREIPAGILSRKEALIFVGVSALIFIFSAAMLSTLCLILSVPVLAILLGYSYTKRFTRYCHLYLGFAIGLAPIGAWVAVTGTLSVSVVFLSLALMTHFAGFDILYACQDIDFDRQEGLFSLPSKIGAQKAMTVSWVLHGMTLACLLGMHLTFGMHPVFLGFIAMIAVLLVIEHRLVRPDDLTHINLAFFHINSVISVLIFVGVLVQGVLK